MDIVQKKTLELHAHPLLERIPELPYDCPERRALVESIRSEGLLQPLLVKDREIVDGRHRHDACRTLGLETIPCIEVEGDIADIIVDSLTQRRHYTKSAIALAAMPLMQAYIAAGRARSIKALENGGSTDFALSAKSTDTHQQFAEKLGVSKRLVGYAQDIFKKLETLGSHILDNNESVEDWVERSVYQEGMGLGTVLQGMAAIEANKSGQAQQGLKKREQYEQLIFKHLETSNKHFKHWDDLSFERKATLLNKVPDLIKEWPTEFLLSVGAQAKKEMSLRNTANPDEYGA
ncbi:ParB N-terminal domain-containing protein [Kiritimatiellaeota bacterium B1221]|nr:ParB N-terminal domain-containing protein [Kiritimatiellaeota bacterium B1221]